MRIEHEDCLTIFGGDVGGHRLVRLHGEIDLAGRSTIDAACLAGNEDDVVIDLAGATFMDCAGYASLLLARRGLVEVGGTATIRNAVGQPARLMALIAQIESTPPHAQDRSLLTSVDNCVGAMTSAGFGR